MILAEFLTQPENVRRRYYAAAEDACGLPGSGIEKDLWVCATLRLLTEIPACKNALTFKGGTSLSKGWKLIERFSEDIDLVLDRERLGVGIVALEQWEDLGSNARQRELDRLRETCKDYVQNTVRGEMEAEILRRFPMLATSTKVIVDAEDSDGQTLLLQYPTAFDHNGYVQPRVKIELGARSDVEPHESPGIIPYLMEALPGEFTVEQLPVRTVAPERTFWEKAMLLHEEIFRPPGSPKGRMSRHYYDLFRLIEAGISGKALATPGLFNAVARHRRVFFSQEQGGAGLVAPGFPPPFTSRRGCKSLGQGLPGHARKHVFRGGPGVRTDSRGRWPFRSGIQFQEGRSLMLPRLSNKLLDEYRDLRLVPR